MTAFGLLFWINCNSPGPTTRDFTVLSSPVTVARITSAFRSSMPRASGQLTLALRRFSTRVWTNCLLASSSGSPRLMSPRLASGCITISLHDRATTAARPVTDLGIQATVRTRDNRAELNKLARPCTWWIGLLPGASSRTSTDGFDSFSVRIARSCATLRTRPITESSIGLRTLRNCPIGWGGASWDKVVSADPASNSTASGNMRIIEIIRMESTGE